MTICMSGPTKEYPVPGNFASVWTKGKPYFSTSDDGTVTCYYNSDSGAYQSEFSIPRGGMCPRKVRTRCEHSGTALVLSPEQREAERAAKVEEEKRENEKYSLYC